MVCVAAAVVLAACSSASKHESTPSTTAPANCAGWDGGSSGVATGDATTAADRCLRLNQVQVVGTHNSYHFRDEPSIFDTIKSFDKALADSIDYTHPVLPTQFSREGVRQIELDVFADPNGGRYAKPKLRELIDHVTTPIPGMSKPGFKVLHASDSDFNSNCLTFIACLDAVKGWSDAHRTHLPIAILVEAKDDPTVDPLKMGFVQPPPLTTSDFDALDAEIRSVFKPSDLITPDDVRGTHATLEEAVKAGGAWPTLGAARGKVLFLLDQSGQRERYIKGHPSLKGRVIFTNATPGEPDAAFVEMNDPTGANQAKIQELVREGYIVRTRSDADTVEARADDTKTRDLAISSGAQYVSTDYPAPDKAPFPGGFEVTLPGNRPWRCDPVNTGPACNSAVLDTR
ncbi:MAG TPA: phosphatidylinositol-specific phospholipase C1-like protein [Acidimicrobiia bacterium]|nr:phosphatidylinositol-specific phospholipase C1-like protein [Acidimicrobiia bacterium]